MQVLLCLVIVTIRYELNNNTRCFVYCYELNNNTRCFVYCHELNNNTRCFVANPSCVGFVLQARLNIAGMLFNTFSNIHKEGRNNFD